VRPVSVRIFLLLRSNGLFDSRDPKPDAGAFVVSRFRLHNQRFPVLSACDTRVHLVVRLKAVPGCDRRRRDTVAAGIANTCC